MEPWVQQYKHALASVLVVTVLGRGGALLVFVVVGTMVALAPWYPVEAMAVVRHQSLSACLECCLKATKVWLAVGMARHAWQGSVKRPVA